jgi:mannan endo-1,4-beta-mannosidase
MNKTTAIFIILIVLSSVSFAQTFKTLEYLKSISGQSTIAGQHNREPLSNPDLCTDSIYLVTGKYPALWSSDFLFQQSNINNRWNMIYEAEEQWNNGAIIQIMFHTCPPTNSEPCGWNGGVLSTLTDEQWAQLITPGTTLYNNWIKRLDIIAPYLQYLKEKEIEVLFRPLHEMNQGAFWWGGRPGENGTARLFRITHDYLTNTKGLDNLIWVWDMQDIDKTWDQYNPGDGYWDILAFDVYGDGYSQSWYNYALSIAGDKLLAIGECGKLPTANQLLAQNRYVFFMAWAEMAFNDNTTEQIRSLYSAPNVITLDEKPGWNRFCSYLGQPSPIPGTIEAENFDDCGEGNSYHDTDAVNSGGEYRAETGVDIQICSEGGFNVFDMQDGEWLAYASAVKSTGMYNIKMNVASQSDGGSLHIETDGKDISGSISVPNTGGGQVWQELSFAASALEAGFSVVKVVADKGNFGLNNFSFILADKAPSAAITYPSGSEIFKTPVNIEIKADASDEDGSITKVEFYSGTEKIGECLSPPYNFTWQNVQAGTYSLTAAATDDKGLTGTSAAVTITVAGSQSPFEETAYNVPGRIEMENYDKGGAGLAYNDLSAGNKFGFYRQDDVDIEECTDTTGGYSLGDFQTTEWVEYSLNITEAGLYDLVLRAATQSAGAKLSIIIGSKNVTNSLAVPSTGGWQVWTDITIPRIQLAAGETIMRVTAAGEYANINYIDFIPSVSVDVADDIKTVPSEFRLEQNYPNPFNPVTSFKYGIPAGGHVTLKIYDILGREISALVNEEKSAGEYNIQFDASSLASGVYYYQLKCNENISTKKMILQK